MRHRYHKKYKLYSLITNNFIIIKECSDKIIDFLHQIIVTQMNSES